VSTATGPVGPAIETIGLVKRYGRTAALAGLSMRVERGEIFGFLGPNGAGKTTAVKLLVGLAAPSGGSGTVLGAPLGDRRTRRRIGYLPELFRYQGWLRAREVVAVHCELADLPRSTWPVEIGTALELVGLADRAADQVATFSKGMQQRLGLGVALLGRPDLVLLDEPTSALDPVGRQDVRRIIGELRQRGTTVFLNSHLLGEVERVCDRVVIVDHGRVVAAGTFDELLGAGLVRVRVTGLTPDRLAGLESGPNGFGRLTLEGNRLTAVGLDPARIPDLVAAVVGLGGRISSVEQVRESLEDRFINLLSGEHVA
jgi:ABC-2 type transport system ATP-binding protein